VIAKLGMFRSPRILHETATKLAPWTNGFALVHGVVRRVVDEDGKAAFEGAGRDVADIVGADTFSVCGRQVEEMLAWRKAGAWDRAVLAVGGISSVARALHLLHEGADAALVATAALTDPLFAVRFREAAAPPPAPPGEPPVATNGARTPVRARRAPAQPARRAKPTRSSRSRHAVR
jgi:hypothetical protein